RNARALTSARPETATRRWERSLADTAPPGTSRRARRRGHGLPGYLPPGKESKEQVATPAAPPGPRRRPAGGPSSSRRRDDDGCPPAPAHEVRTAAGTRRETSAVVAEVQVLQRDRLAGAHAERREVDLVVAEARVELRLGLLGRLDLDLGVPGKTGTGRDELTDDDVLLEAEERVATTAHRGLGEHARRLLEGGGRQPRVRRERRLRDAHQ